MLRSNDASPLRWRTTRICPDGYLANTCQHRRSVLGNFPLYEAIIEYQAQGGDLQELPRIPSALPEGTLDWLHDRILGELHFD